MSNTTELTTGQASAEAVNREARASTDEPSRVTPAVDIFEDSQGITLYADLPGVPREKLDVRVQDGRLTIQAEAVISTPPGLRLHHGEVRHPHFFRAFALGADLDVSRIDAQLRDGVLKLVVPHREEARPRRIQVSVG
jgi:HSP20 family protein